MFSLGSDKITASWPNDSLTFTLYVKFSNRIPNWTTFVKEFFDSKFTLESDKMTALWENDRLTLTFYVTFPNSIPNWTTFLKEIFWLYA